MNFWPLMFIFSSLCFAHQSSMTPSGENFFWANLDIPITNIANTRDMPSNQAKTVISDSINQWNKNSRAKIRSTTASKNVIKFVPDFPYGPAVVGITEVSYNSKGAIQKASIYLNDDFFFHSSPGIYPGKEVFLGDVVTHELGHLLGLSHSEVLNSSMFYSSFSGQSSLASDDRGGIRYKYNSNYGSISGVVKGGNDVGVLGVHVQAISRNSGEATSSISDENGRFTIGGLNLNDTYYLYTSPLKNPSSLPDYFLNSQQDFCPGSYVGSFFTPCGRHADGKPNGITLSKENSSVNVGTLSINCSLRSDYDYDNEKLKRTFSSINIFDYSVDQKFEKSFVGWFRKDTSHNWSIEDVFTINLEKFLNLDGSKKYLKVGLVSYPFGNQLEYQMSIYRQDNLLVTKGLSYSRVDQTYNTDFFVYIPLESDPAENIFEVRIKSRKLNYAPETFPVLLKFTSDEHLPYLLMTSLYENDDSQLSPLLDREVNLSDNESCLDAPFTFAVSKSNTAMETQDSNDDQLISAAAASCGTLGPPGNGPPSPPYSLVMGFLLSFFTFACAKGYKKFLS